MEQASSGKGIEPALARSGMVDGRGGAIGGQRPGRSRAPGAELGRARSAMALPLAVAASCGPRSAWPATSRSRSVNGRAASILRRFGGLDVVVSNAGAPGPAPSRELPRPRWGRFELNSLSIKTVAQRVAILSRPGLRAAAAGQREQAALNPGAIFGCYGIAKGPAWP